MPFDYNAVKDLIRCPESHSPLVQSGNALICQDPVCRLRFDVRDGIPILLLDEATKLSENEWQVAMDGHAASP